MRPCSCTMKGSTLSGTIRHHLGWKLVAGRTVAGVLGWTPDLSLCANPPELGQLSRECRMRSRKQPRDRVKNKARQSREQKSAVGSNTTIKNKPLCAARDSEKAPKHKRLPRSCSTSMCCAILGEGPKTQAYTPILFNIYVLLGIFRKPQSRSVCPDLLQCLRAARDLKKASEHKRLPLSCSTSTCCERFREAPKHSVYPDLVQHLCTASEGSKTQAFTPIMFNIYVLREIWRRPQNKSVYPFHFV